jgi:hypothetical protein
VLLLMVHTLGGVPEDGVVLPAKALMLGLEFGFDDMGCESSAQLDDTLEGGVGFQMDRGAASCDIDRTRHVLAELLGRSRADEVVLAG